MGGALPVRMTVLRLSGGDLILHSPVAYSRDLHDAVRHLGSIRYLLAPNIAHWMFVKGWQDEVPEAITFGVPGLARRKQVRQSGLRIDRELTEGPPEEWGNEIATVLTASPPFAEIALFHKASRTLVLTDLAHNLSPDTLPVAGRAAAKIMGNLAPNGKAPGYLRMALRLNRRSVAEAAARLVALAPQRVVIGHGEWWKDDATARLEKSLRWVLQANPGAMAGMRVVITGASSGIGRTAVLAFAREGASLVLAARREQVLKDLAKECEGIGGRAFAVATDVTDATAVQQLARRADQAFGGIDVWINNAGTGVIGPYQDAEMALHRRVVEVNLLGTMNGAAAALPIFLGQDRGILINNISLGGWAPTPFASAYTASKFGLRGFTASLRQELADHPNIHVCGVFPAIIDTPGFVHGANQSDRSIDPGPFLYRPEDVAVAFLRLVRHPRDEVAVGWPARLGQLAYDVAPRATEHILGHVFRRLFTRAKPAPKSDGEVLQPGSLGCVNPWRLARP